MSSRINTVTVKVPGIQGPAGEFTPQEGADSMIYGVRWDKTSGDPACEPGVVVNGSFVLNDYQTFPVQEQIGRGLLTGAGVWTKLSKYNSYFDEDGAAATLNGDSGHIMARSPYRFYLNVQTIGDYVYILISKQAFSYNGVDAWIPPVYLNDSYFYVGAMHGVAMTDSVGANVGSCIIDTSGYTTNSYPDPFTNIDIGDSQSQCAATGDVFCGYGAGMHELLYLLSVVEFKTFDVQSVIEGHTERSSFNYSQVTPAGTTLSLGDFSGSIYDDDAGLYIANSYRGIEHFFGNTNKWAFGIAFNTDDNYRVYIAYDPSLWTTTGADILTDYINTGHAPAWDDNDDFIKSIIGSGKYIPLYPDVVGGGAISSTYITDYLWSDPLGSGWRFSTVGGQSYNGRLAGPGARTVSHSSSFSHSLYGPRLAAYISLAA